MQDRASRRHGLLGRRPRPPRRRPPASGRSWPGRRRRATAGAAAGGRARCPRRRARARRRPGARRRRLEAHGDALGRVRGRLAEAREHVAPRARGRAGSAGIGLDRWSPPISRLELVGRALGDDAPVVDDPDAVGQHVGLLEVLRGQEDGDAVVGGQPLRPRPTARCGSAGRGRWWARRGRGSTGCGRARARGPGGASCRPSSRRPCGRPPRSGRRARAARCRGAARSALPRPLQAGLQVHVLAAGEERGPARPPGAPRRCAGARRRPAWRRRSPPPRAARRWAAAAW